MSRSRRVIRPAVHRSIGPPTDANGHLEGDGIVSALCIQHLDVAFENFVAVRYIPDELDRASNQRIGSLHFAQSVNLSFWSWPIGGERKLPAGDEVVAVACEHSPAPIIRSP